MKQLISVCLLLTFSSVSFANPVSCQSGKLTRSLEVVYSNPGQAVPCEVIYDKSTEGSIATLWHAHYQAGYCEKKAEGMADKLIDWGWDCTSARNQGATDEDAGIADGDSEAADLDSGAVNEDGAAADANR